MGQIKQGRGKSILRGTSWERMQQNQGEEVAEDKPKAWDKQWKEMEEQQLRPECSRSTGTWGKARLFLLLNCNFPQVSPGFASLLSTGLLSNAVLAIGHSNYLLKSK